MFSFGHITITAHGSGSIKTLGLADVEAYEVQLTTDDGSITDDLGNNLRTASQVIEARNTNTTGPGSVSISNVIGQATVDVFNFSSGVGGFFVENSGGSGLTISTDGLTSTSLGGNLFASANDGPLRVSGGGELNAHGSITLQSVTATVTLEVDEIQSVGNIEISANGVPSSTCLDDRTPTSGCRPFGVTTPVGLGSVY